jgi:hypothetical protein
MGKDVEGSRIGLEALGKPRKTSVRIISVPTEIRTGHFPNTGEPTSIFLC